MTIENLFDWPVDGVVLSCPECGAPAVESRVAGRGGLHAAYAVRCSQCWRAQCTDISPGPHSRTRLAARATLEVEGERGGG